MSPDLPAPVRDLLAAIGEALDVPSPSLDRDAEIAHRRLVDDRILYVRASIRDLLAGDHTLGIEWEANYLRRKAAERPATYRTSAQALKEHHGGEGQ